MQVRLTSINIHDSSWPDTGSRSPYGGVFFRVIVPASSRDEADDICFDPQEAGGDCFVLR
jgi:hypothetical protein